MSIRAKKETKKRGKKAENRAVFAALITKGLN
jgi:hypothetical protein